jgi:hypothetical protein
MWIRVGERVLVNIEAYRFFACHPYPSDDSEHCRIIGVAHGEVRVPPDELFAGRRDEAFKVLDAMFLQMGDS